MKKGLTLFSVAAIAAALVCCVFVNIAAPQEGTAPSENRAAGLSDSAMTSARQMMTDIWNVELWSLDGRSVTLKKTIIALMIVVLGFLATKYVCWALGKRLLARTRMDENTTAIVQKMMFYFLILFVLLFGLRILNIPLTAFTFLGGALAIGVGFGAQNILSNFISGFIIMAERPIRVGDLIEVEGNFATVEEVGFRCTRIRTADNVHILVPNSKFLDQSIINWTLSDRQVRVRIVVGVVYGSPVRDVERLLMESARTHASVRKDPAPYVRFTDFGDNSLVFELFFWVSMNNILERVRIASDIRFGIDELFRKAGIVIAFPQRDVHLDTLKPLEVRLVSPAGPGKDDN